MTGADTDFSDGLASYLSRCRATTDLPLALGYGVKSRADIDALRGRAEICVVGSETLRVMDERGVSGLGGYIRDLRSSDSGIATEPGQARVSPPWVAAAPDPPRR